MSLSASTSRRLTTRLATVVPTARTTAVSNRAFTTLSLRSSARYGIVGACALSACVFAGYRFYSSSSSLSSSSTMEAAAAAPKPALDDKNFLPLKLKSIVKYNHNSNIYHFALPDPHADLNLPVSSCIVTRYKGADGKDVIRPYTPIELQTKGELVMLVKEYPNGNMSKHIASLKAGDTLDVKGPIPKLTYTPNMKKKIGFLVGGSGVTPAMQVIEEVLRNPADKTELYLMFANQTPQDILMKETIDQLAQKHKNFHPFYIVDKAVDGWKGAVGHIDRKFIEANLPIKASEGESVLIYVCGPPPMYAALSGSKAPDYSQGEVNGVLKELSFNEKQVYKF